MQVELMAEVGDNVPNRGFGLRAIDFGDGKLLDIATSDLEKNQEKILEFLQNDFQKFVQKVIDQDVIEHYEQEDDSVICIDTDKESIHIGYLDEYGL